MGGLSIKREIQALCPNLIIHQFADHAWMPYGTRPPSEITKRVVKLVPAICQFLHPDIVVIACNTASTQTLPALRAKLNIPIVGVVPAIKPAVGFNHPDKVIVLATTQTVKSDYTHTLIDQYAKGTEVILLASDSLVAIAESKIRGHDITKDISAFYRTTLAKHLTPNSNVVLACTHFPLIKQELHALMWPSIPIIDSGHAIARRVSSLLPHAHITHSEQARFLSSDVIDDELMKSIVSEGFSEISQSVLVELD